MLEVMQVATFGLGCFTTLLSAGLCVYFSRSRQRIGRSVSFMLFGESVAGATTVVFSANSLINTLVGVESHLWNSIPSQTAIVMRWVMFLAMGASSIHLTLSVREILREDDDGRSDKHN